MKKCLIVQPVHEVGLALLREHGITPVIAPSSDMTVISGMVPGMNAVITRNAGLTAQAFAAADQLEVVVVHGSGHNAVDKTAAKAANVLVCNTPALNARSVAELALGLGLAVARGISAGDRAARADQPGFRESASFTELWGKCALIVGWGAIGSKLGPMLANAFGMQVLVHSPNAPETGGFERVALEDGLARADLISLHTPVRPGARKLITAARLAMMKPGAILINTAREGLVDEDALADALRTGHLAGAGLDVYNEPAKAGPLADLPNVVLTPHLGATTEDALRAVALGAAGHVITALSGKLPETALNADDIGWPRG